MGTLRKAHNFQLALLAFAVTATAHASECLSFGHLPKHFTTAFELDEKTARLRFKAAALGSKELSQKAYVVQNDGSCSHRGVCDSALYLMNEKGCYREVLKFHGRWLGRAESQQTPSSRTPASVRIEAEGGIFVYSYDPKLGDYGVKQ